MTRWIFRLLVVPVAAAALLLVGMRPSTAYADTNVVAANYGVIVRTAIAALNQQRGECFPWVRSVVQAAVGRTIGFDYNLGYLQAGAVEVPIASARDGDVIQIANPAITRPDADYPGLHTAIVIDNLGSGMFRVVDSNSNFDGVVHVRDTYKPAELVARYPGLVVRAYRFSAGAGNVAAAGTTPVIAAPSPIPVVAVAPTPGARVTVAADGDCLRVRSTAGLAGSVLGCLPSGSSAMVTQVGPTADGYSWVQVAAGSLTGWAAANYLATAGASAPVAAAVPAPSVSPIATTPTVTAPARGAFASPPQFAAGSGQASAVFLGGSADQLIGAATDAKASGVWVQDTNGGFQLLIVNGPTFMMDAFRSKFSGFSGPTAVTLIGSAT